MRKLGWSRSATRILLIVFILTVSFSSTAFSSAPLLPTGDPGQINSSDPRLLPQFSGEADPPQWSTTGPTPPPEVLLNDALKAPDRPADVSSEVVLPVPAYIWRHGCGPTAVGMVVGYYDTYGFGDLIPGSALTQTEAVNQMIASGGRIGSPNPPGQERHFEDYSMPIDDSTPAMLPDDYITKGRTPHTDDSVADFMRTSQSAYGGRYGWSNTTWFGSSFINYAHLKNPLYEVSAQIYAFSNIPWSRLTAEIDAGHPMVFLVDSNGDGRTDHFVPAIGYRDSPTLQYASRDTWYTSVRWQNFTAMASGTPWGIWGGWTFSISNPAPVLAGLDLTSAVAGSSGLTLTVNGTKFLANSVVRWNGSDRPTTYISATELTAQITTADLAAAGTFPVTVFTPGPGGGISNAVNFTVNNPVPTISSLGPSSTLAGGPAFTLTVHGTGYTTGSIVRWNGNSRPTTWIDNTQLTAAIPAADIVSAGSFQVTVFNPAPGGGTSGQVTFKVNNPVPTITALDPSSVTAGDAGFLLKVNGSGFVPGSVVSWNSIPRTTTYVNATRLTIVIVEADIAAVGAIPVTVVNPGPGGGISTSFEFKVERPLLKIYFPVILN